MADRYECPCGSPCYGKDGDGCRERAAIIAYASGLAHQGRQSGSLIDEVASACLETLVERIRVGRHLEMPPHPDAKEAPNG
jgi:hypothetical protein